MFRSIHAALLALPLGNYARDAAVPGGWRYFPGPRDVAMRPVCRRYRELVARTPRHPIATGRNAGALVDLPVHDLVRQRDELFRVLRSVYTEPLNAIEVALGIR